MKLLTILLTVAFSSSAFATGNPCAWTLTSLHNNEKNLETWKKKVTADCAAATANPTWLTKQNCARAKEQVTWYEGLVAKGQVEYKTCTENAAKACADAKAALPADIEAVKAAEAALAKCHKAALSHFPPKLNACVDEKKAAAAAVQKLHQTQAAIAKNCP